MCEAVEKYANKKYVDGLEKGVEQGIEKGIEKGIEQTRNNLIQNMLRNGMTAEEISRNAGVDLDIVKSIGEKCNVIDHS